MNCDSIYCTAKFCRMMLMQRNINFVSMTLAVMIVLSIMAGTGEARLAGECAMQCNDMRKEVLTLEICK